MFLKKMLFVFFLVLFSNFVFASIDNLKVPSEVRLGEILTIDGSVSPVEENVVCSIRVYDIDSNNLVKRLTDEFTSSGGHFSSDYLVISEPTFLRESDYNAVVDCGTSRDSSSFNILQRRNLIHFAEQETLFVFDKGNWEVFYIWGSIGLFFFIVAGILIFWWKKGNG